MYALVHLAASILLVTAPPAGGSTDCPVRGIRCGERIAGRIVSTDCSTEDGLFFDLYRLRGREERRVRVQLRSLLWEPELVLADGRGRAVAAARGRPDGAPATLARTLAGGRDWLLVVTFPGGFRSGDYELALECADPDRERDSVSSPARPGRRQGAGRPEEP